LPGRRRVAAGTPIEARAPARMTASSIASSSASSASSSGRPRERLLLYGREALSDVELVALVLGGGHALERGFTLLAALGGLVGIDRACPQELCRAPGVGVAGAAALAAACELSRRVAAADLPWAEPLRGPSDVAGYVRTRLGAAVQETFVVLGLDARQRVRLVRTVALGSLAQVDVHPREVFRPLVRAGMHSAIVVHNHPSGDAEPSAADIDLTRRLSEVGRLVGIPILDHLVVTAGAHASLAERGLVHG
jgi:DNA repair protein RadC